MRAERSRRPIRDRGDVPDAPPTGSQKVEPGVRGVDGHFAPDELAPELAVRSEQERLDERRVHPGEGDGVVWNRADTRQEQLGVDVHQQLVGGSA